MVALVRALAVWLNPAMTRFPAMLAAKRSTRVAAASLILLLVSIAVYAPALKGDFLWDDDLHLTANILTQPDGLYRSWFTTDQPVYYPVTWTALWLQWRLWGMSPTGYHVVSVLLHALCCVGIHLVLRQLKIPAAWLTALLFAIHPVNVETVAWISQQRSLWSLLLACASVMLFLAFDGNRRRGLYVMSLVAFLASMLAKSATVMLPCVLLLSVWWRRRGRLRVRDLVETFPFLVLALLLSLTEIWFQYNRALAAHVSSAGLASRAAGAGHAVLFYLGKLFLPHNLSIVYSNRTFEPVTVVSLLPVALVAAFFAAAWTARRSWGRAVLFGFGYYVAALLPVLGFFNIGFMRYSWVSDHWQYVALIGPVALAVGSVCHLGAKLSARARRLLAVAVVIAAAALAHQSFRRASTFADREALWEDTLSKNPGAWVAMNNYASLLLEQGRVSEATTYLRRALALKPQETRVRLNLARALQRRGGNDEAISLLKGVLETSPDHPDAHHELGRTLLAAGDLDGAEASFSAVLMAAPGRADATIGLALLAERRGNAAKAVDIMARCIEQHPADAVAHHAFGDLLFAHGRLQQALNLYLRTRDLDPSFPDVHNDLGVTCARLGRFDRAAEHFRRAVNASPHDSKARQNLARALGDAGRARGESGTSNADVENEHLSPKE